jgi:hypothetical protein
LKSLTSSNSNSSSKSTKKSSTPSPKTCNPSIENNPTVHCSMSASSTPSTTKPS